MIVETIENLKRVPFAIRIKGKGLLYNVDLQGDISEQDDALVFKTTGHLRFGVLTSPGSFISKYRATETSVGFLEHSIEFPKIGFLEKYVFKNNKIIFAKNRQNEKPVDGWVEPIMDPLPLIYRMISLSPDEEIQFEGPLLVGGKQKKVGFVKNGAQVKVSLNDKILFEGAFKGSKLSLVIPKFKMKLELSRI